MHAILRDRYPASTSICFKTSIGDGLQFREGEVAAAKPHLSKPVLLSQFLVCVIPLCLAMYWFVFPLNQDLANLCFRPTIVATCVIMSLLWWHLPVTQAEKDLAGIAALLCTVLLALSLTSIDPGRAFPEWLKLLIICATSLLLCRGLRHVPTATMLGSALILCSALNATLILSTYLKYQGLVWPTYATTRVLKGELLNAGLPFNATAFECVFAYISGMCLLRGTKLLWVLGSMVLVISSVVSGSRTPLAVVGVSGLVLIMITALRSRHLLTIAGGMILAAAMVAGVIVTTATVTGEEMSVATEGRWELWSIALQKFIQRPVVGWGYLSSEDDASYIPGGYHNEYLTALAEQGIVGFVAVMILFWFLLRCGCRLAFKPSFTCCRGHGQWALFGCIFLLLRAVVELPGLFGTAQGPADFLAYIFLAIIVSRISREEDHTLARRYPV